MREQLTLKSGELFRGSTLQHDVLTLSDFYSNRGYAFVNVDPRTQLDPAAHIINVTFAINPGRWCWSTASRSPATPRPPTGHPTRDADPGAGAVLGRSHPPVQVAAGPARFLRRDPHRHLARPPSPTASISTSTCTRPTPARSRPPAGSRPPLRSSAISRIGNTNLFGGGQAILLDARSAILFQNYSISYTEPYFLDIPLTAGLELLRLEHLLPDFNRSAIGFSVRTLYSFSELGLKKIGPLSLEDVTAGLEYKFESVGIGGLDNPLTTYQIRRYKGYSQTSEIAPTLRRFTVNNPIDPRYGSVQTLTLEVAGLGGSNYFLKGVFHTRFFFSFIDNPELGNWVYSIGGDYGIGTNLQGGTGGELPLYERFFPGGVGGGGDVRGYELYRLGPQVTLFNQAGQPFSYQDIGGSREVLLSTEITFPILEGLGLRGVIFLDAGNSFRLSDSVTVQGLQAAYGIGLRWRSPFGPLRIEFAKPINPRPNDQRTDFVFGAGSPL